MHSSDARLSSDWHTQAASYGTGINKEILEEPVRFQRVLSLSVLHRGIYSSSMQTAEACCDQQRPTRDYGTTRMLLLYDRIRSFLPGDEYQ